MLFFWVLAPCTVSIYRAEDGDSMFLRNVGSYLRLVVVFRQTRHSTWKYISKTSALLLNHCRWPSSWPFWLKHVLYNPQSNQQWFSNKADVLLIYFHVGCCVFDRALPLIVIYRNRMLSYNQLPTSLHGAKTQNNIIVSSAWWRCRWAQWRRHVNKWVLIINRSVYKSKPESKPLSQDFVILHSPERGKWDTHALYNICIYEDCCLLGCSTV
jgi:hypothetical protein